MDELSTAVAQVLQGDLPIAWLGAGMSVPLGYPPWDELLQRLCGACSREDLLESDLHPLDIASECRKSNGRAYRDLLLETFGRRTVAARLAYLHLLRLPFSAFITTNYDPTLKATAEALGQDHRAHPYPDLPLVRIGSSPRPIYYLHGIAEAADGQRASVDHLVLAREDYEDAYVSSGAARDLVREVFKRCSIVFMGARLNEPYLREVVRNADRQLDDIDSYAGVGARPRPRRLWLMGRRPVDESLDPQAVEEEQRRLEEELAQLVAMGMEPMWFQADDNHSQLESTLVGAQSRLGDTKRLTELRESKI